MLLLLCLALAPCLSGLSLLPPPPGRHLVVGDGDLSYGAFQAKSEQQRSPCELIVSVLESEQQHRDTYSGSRANHDAIEGTEGARVLYGVDATNLAAALSAALPPSPTFSSITFNYPHWPGKSNLRENRLLLLSFLRSAAPLLAPYPAAVSVALAEGQGGSSSPTRAAWRQSWQAGSLAAEAGLLLLETSPHTHLSSYNRSSHRGVDRGFRVGQGEVHTFALPSPACPAADESCRMCSFFELHVLHSPSAGALVAAAVAGAARRAGLEGEVSLRERFGEGPPGGGGKEWAVYEAVAVGVRAPATREAAGEVRRGAQEEMAGAGLELRQGGRRSSEQVSNVIPLATYRRMQEKWGMLPIPVPAQAI